jgi:diguanylate cyclase (GGDEF)-like protein
MAIATDAEGFVWLAAMSGVARYDGHRWETFPAPRGQFRDLFLDHEGTLWLTYDDRRPVRLEGGRWRAEGGVMPTEHVFRILETADASGRPETWAVTTNAGILRRVGARWMREPGNEELPPGRLHAVARTHQVGGGERLWAATFNEGLWYRPTGGRWTRYRAGAFDPAQVDDLAVARFRGREELWVGTYGFGLWRVTDGGAEHVAPDAAEPGASMIYTLRVSPGAGDDGRVVWASSRGGLLRVQGETMQVFDRRHGLPSNGVRNIHLRKTPGGDDVLWLATEAGVARASGGRTPWRTASLLGSASNGVFGVLVEPDGRGGERLWVTTLSEGVGVWEDGRWRLLTRADGTLPADGARLVARVPFDDGAEDVLLGLVGGDLARVRGGRVELMPTPWPKSAGQVAMDVLVRTAGGRPEWWVATRESGIWRRAGGRWTEFTAGGAGQWRVVKLVEQVDRAGRSWLWATSNQGLARFDGESWTILGEADGLPDDNLVGLSLLKDRAGHEALWAGSTLAGVVRVDVTDPEQPRVLGSEGVPPPPHPGVYGAVGDSKGHVWVCTNDGVQLLTPDPRGGYRERVFRRGDGLVHEECNTNAELVDAHDRYWMGTLGGLSVFDPAGAVPDRERKPLRLTHVRVDGAEVDARGAVRVPAGARELRVEYSLLSWQREAESRYRPWLVGYEPAPEAWEAQNFRVFGALPPRAYTLRVEAKDYAGFESAPLEIAIEVLPAWWQSVVFRGAAILFFVLAGPLFDLRRVKRLSRQKRELEELVAARTSELAAANERLAHLSREDPLTGVANRRRLDEALEDEWRRAERHETPLAFLLLDVDHFKAYNDLLGHRAGDGCLAAVAAAGAAANTRAGARVAPNGGEEVAVLMPGADLAAALPSAENARRRVEMLLISHPGSAVAQVVTVSVGVACARPGVDTAAPSELVEAADRALYEAKSEGRNRVRAGGASRAGSVVRGRLPYTPPP